jgi:hypothetical protein
MNCAKLVCGECATEWDGVNYCAACLAERRGGEKRRASLLGGLVLLFACVLLFAASSELMLWSAALFAQLL